MALLKKSPAPEPFRVPSLEEVSPDYAALTARHRDLDGLRARLEAEAADLRRQIAEDPAPQVPARVAELLGDEPDSRITRRQRLAEIRQELGAIETALAVLRQRVAEAKTEAGRAARAAVAPEFQRRLDAMCAAMRTLDAAHRAFDDLWREIEDAEIGPASLGPRPFFLGGAREDTRRIASFLKEAGYVD